MNHPLLASACALVLGVLPATAQTLMRTVNGVGSDAFGRATVFTADQNNDGFNELLVGSPGANSGTGKITCISGKFLATGSGVSVLWSISPTFNTFPTPAAVGSAIAEVGTVVGDSATDFAVCAPGFSSTFTLGAVCIIDGSTHAIAATIFGPVGGRFGSAVAAVGDQD